jgi:RND family efflux transporter MFP subunit
MANEDTAHLLAALAIDRNAGPRPRRWPYGLLVLALLAALGGWWWRSDQARPVQVVTLARSTLANNAPASVLEATGYVTARRQATVSSKITGRVAEVRIEEGQQVAAGEVLAQLDATDAQAALALANAEVAAARSQLNDLEVQRAQAGRDAQRQRTLVARRLASPQSVEDAETRVASLTARLASQRVQITVAERSLAVAQVGLDNTVIRAPFAGVVTVKAAQPGEIVSPISAGGGFTRTGIGTIVDMDSLEIEVEVNEAYISRVSPGQTVKATLNAYPDWALPASVITIIPTADRAKATVKVRIAIAVRDPRIVPEMGVRVGFMERATAAPASPPAAVLLAPADALVQRGDRNLLWLVEDGRLALREVTLGQQRANEREILTGAGAGDTVVVKPAADLTEGLRVVPQPGAR